MTIINFAPTAWNGTQQQPPKVTTPGHTPTSKKDSFTYSHPKTPSKEQDKKGIVLKLLEWILGDNKSVISQEEAYIRAISEQHRAQDLTCKQAMLIMQCAKNNFQPTQTDEGNFVWFEESGKTHKTMIEFDENERPFRKTRFLTKNLKIIEIKEEIPNSNKINKIVFFGPEMDIANGVKRENGTDFIDELILFINNKPYRYSLNYEADSRKTYSTQSFSFQ